MWWVVEFLVSGCGWVLLFGLHGVFTLLLCYWACELRGKVHSLPSCLMNAFGINNERLNREEVRQALATNLYQMLNY